MISLYMRFLSAASVSRDFALRIAGTKRLDRVARFENAPAGTCVILLRFNDLRLEGGKARGRWMVAQRLEEVWDEQILQIVEIVKGVAGNFGDGILVDYYGFSQKKVCAVRGGSERREEAGRRETSDVRLLNMPSGIVVMLL